MRIEISSGLQCGEILSGRVQIVRRCPRTHSVYLFARWFVVFGPTFLHSSFPDNDEVMKPMAAVNQV